MNIRQLKRLITPDMVSFWVPGGKNQAIDLIRGNHGQVIGAHSSVPVLPNLVNPSVGWHFDGTNDYVDLTGFTDAGTTHTLSFWVYSHDSTTSRLYLFDSLAGRLIVGWGSDTPGKIGVFDNAWKEFGNSPSADAWHCVVFVLNGTTSKMKMYLNGSQYGSELDYDSRSIGGAMMIGSIYTGTGNFFDGYIALPFIANKAWSAEQVKNFHLATKSLFSPRG